MNGTINKDIPQVRLRAFRAIDEPDTCAAFVEGHANVLTSIGIKKVTSSKNEWTYNPAVFVIVVESLDGKEIYGGERIHVSGGTQPLPIEEAVSIIDPSVHKLVWQYAQQGTGEICGLWNSKEFAGYGIGSPLLIRSGIAMASQIGLKTLFALCAPYTVQPVANCGMELVDNIGNKGTFYYPKLDLVATAMVLHDLVNLNGATAEDKDIVLQMRNNPDTYKITEMKQRDIEIEFALSIPHLDKWDLAATIANTRENPFNKDVDESNLSFF